MLLLSKLCFISNLISDLQYQKEKLLGLTTVLVKLILAELYLSMFNRFAT